MAYGDTIKQPSRAGVTGVIEINRGVDHRFRMSTLFFKSAQSTFFD